MNLNPTELLAVKRLLGLEFESLQKTIEVFNETCNLEQNQVDCLKVLLEMTDDEQKNVINLCEALKGTDGVVRTRDDVPRVAKTQAKRHPRLVRQKKTRKTKAYIPKRNKGTISRDAAKIGRALMNKLEIKRAAKVARYKIGSSKVTWDQLKDIAPPSKHWPEGLLKPASVGMKLLVTPKGLELPPGFADRVLYGMARYNIGEEDISAVKKSFKWAYDTDRPITATGMMAWRPPIIFPDFNSIETENDDPRFTMQHRISISYHLWRYLYRKLRMTPAQFVKLKKTKLSSGSIENLLNAKCTPLISTLQELSLLLNMPINQLIGLKVDFIRSDYPKKLVTYMKELV